MKQTLIIFGFLLATITTFAQSPRIKLNQITKDTVKGSVLISNPTDSGMVYSRDFFISYGADTVLVLYGDTLAATSGIISSVLSDGLTINGDGTTGSELEVDTSFIATLTALSDSLATISASTEADGVTITGVGTVANPLKVDTLLIATIKALNDTLTNRGYLLESQLTDTLDANTRGYLTAEVDGSISNEGSLTVGAGTASTSVISSNTSGSTDVTLTAGTNVTLSESGNNITIAATGGGTSFNNISETADTVFISGDLNVDANTLRVDATNNKVGIGTASPSGVLHTVATSSSNVPIFQRNGSGDVMVIKMANYFGSNVGAQFGFEMKNSSNLNTFAGFFGFGVTNSNAGSETSDIFFRPYNGGTFNEGLRIKGAGEIFMPDVYYDDISGKTRKALYIASDGQLGYDGSSIKMKTNVDEFFNIDWIYDLTPISFNYRKKDADGNYTEEFIDRVDYGLIAEEVVAINDNIVYFDEDENGKYASGVHYTGLIAPLLKAVQLQKKEIETQQTEIDQLKTLITDLTNRLIILENK